MNNKKINDHSKMPKFEYNYIVDGIYLGTNQCCQTHFKKELVKKGVQTDISVEGERIDMPYGASFYIWIPVKDAHAPKMKQLKTGVELMIKCVETKEKMYVHCKNGHGRAPTFVAAYLIKTRGWMPKKALSFIKKYRPVIHLQPVQKEILEKFANQSKPPKFRSSTA